MPSTTPEVDGGLPARPTRPRTPGPVGRTRRKRIEVLEPAGHPSRGSHTASASEPVSAANTRSGEALITQTAVSAQLTADAPVTLIDHP
jgi:hypothetical protein